MEKEGGEEEQAEKKDIAAEGNVAGNQNEEAVRDEDEDEEEEEEEEGEEEEEEEDEEEEEKDGVNGDKANSAAAPSSTKLFLDGNSTDILNRAELLDYFRAAYHSIHPPSPSRSLIRHLHPVLPHPNRLCGVS